MKHQGLPLLLCLGGWCLVGCAGGAQKAPVRQGPPGGPVHPVTVIQCSGASLPASFVAERGPEDIERAGAAFAETREAVLTTVGLFLGTGRWAERLVRVQQQRGPLAGGDEESCRALREVSSLQGRSGVWPGGGPAAIAGLVSYAYTPTTAAGGAPPAITLRLVAVLVGSGGTIEKAAEVSAQAAYARIAMGYQERNPQEVTLELTEQLVKGLERALAPGR